MRTRTPQLCCLQHRTSRTRLLSLSKRERCSVSPFAVAAVAALLTALAPAASYALSTGSVIISSATPPNPPTAFALDLGESSNRLIGFLATGATTPLYWYVNYPCALPPAAGSSLNYTVTVGDSNPGTVTSGNLTLTTRSELSSNAGGQVVNQTIGVGIVVGQTVTVNYTFGNPSNSADAMIQPAGNVSFDSGCFRLTGTAVTGSTCFTAGPLVGADNKPYFPSAAASNDRETVGWA